MFPYVGLATLPLFCNNDWPLKLKETLLKCRNQTGSPSTNSESKSKPLEAVSDKKNVDRGAINWKKRLVSSLVIVHIVVQCLLPYSHGITKVV